MTLIHSLKIGITDAVRRRLSAKPALTEGDLELAAKGPLVVAGLFSTANGIGESARLCADTFEDAGLDVRRVDLSAAFRQQDLPAHPQAGPLPDADAGTAILHLNPPETPKGLVDAGLTGHKRWRTVGYWVWEFAQAPADWARAEALVSEVWTPSRFCAEAFQAITSRPIKIAPHSVRVPNAPIAPSRFLKDLPEGALATLCMADGRSSFDRKNLQGAIEAFLRGLGDRPDCWLVVKTRNLNAHRGAIPETLETAEAHPRIRLIDQSLCAEEKWSLINNCDIFLSLHRSEGFGLVMAEAMALGRCVVATGWSGNLDFMDEGSARLIPFQLVPAADRAGIYTNTTDVWATPSIAAAAAALKDLADNPGKRTQLGAKAQEKVNALLNGSHYIKALQD